MHTFLDQVYNENFDLLCSRFISMSTVLSCAVFEIAPRQYRIATGSADGTRVWEYFLDSSRGNGLSVGSSFDNNGFLFM